MTDTPEDKDFEAQIDALDELADKASAMCEGADGFDGHNDIELMPSIVDFNLGPVKLTMVLADQRRFGLTFTQQQFEYTAHIFDLIRNHRRALSQPDE